MRDDFPSAVQRELSSRVGGVCSNAFCRRPTSGPKEGSGGAVSVGVAAHITAASPGGPRYDASLTQEERRSAENGIWLCQTCARLIDVDNARYTVRIIQTWKKTAEETAQAELERGARTAAVQPSFPPLYVHNQFNDHPPLRAFANQIAERGFDSGWVQLNKVEAKRTLGYCEQYFEGHEVRTEMSGRDHVWMVRSPEARQS